MKLKEIHRTSTFAWSPAAALPLIATGTVAGALDASFSDESSLEIWAPSFLDRNEYDLGGPGQTGPRGVVTDSTRFNRLVWGYVDDSRPQGVIAAGMENGELALWDPTKILAGETTPLLRNSKHTGPVRALDYNPIQKNLLASGAVAGEVYIWDLKDPTQPYSPTPGARSTKLDEITSVAWNQQVQSVLAGASSTGYTVVWDLRGKREVVALAYGGGAGTLAGQNAGSGPGGRRGMSDIAWHPDNATRLVTASEDDSSPIVMVWDLRNARAPEKILTGHEKGILSLSWCRQDADLLLSCGKDNRALCWNPQAGEVIGELPSADNWAFQVDWCPRNPDLLATAFFDGTIGIHSIQSIPVDPASVPAATAASDGADIFNAPGFTNASHAQDTFSLKQPPKWLRRSASSSFGFGGKLVSVSNLPSKTGENQSRVVHLRKVVTEEAFVDRAKALQEAVAGGDADLRSFAESKSETADIDKEKEGWRALRSIFEADGRDELVTLLGFSKEEIKQRVTEAVEKLKLKAASVPSLPLPIPDNVSETASEGESREPVVSFAEPVHEASAAEDTIEKTPSEVSASATSDATSGARLADGESTTTVPSLFGDDVDAAGPQLDLGPDTGADFFSTISQGSQRDLVPHTNYAIDSSVAATIGSRPSSVGASESGSAPKPGTFQIYPDDESEVESLITKALILGDFASAVELSLSADRFADAILLAVRGGPELLASTQKAYFAKQSAPDAGGYLRLFQSIVTNDLEDVVKRADLEEWKEIFVVLCTFASKEDFPGLVEALGRRLEFHSRVGTEGEFRKYATLTYLAAAKLERLVSIWVDEMKDEEEELTKDERLANEFTAHALALQSFIEKVTVFRAATQYVDQDASAGEVDLDEHKLAGLYERYFEYADILASQGLVTAAARFLQLTPSTFRGAKKDEISAKRDRLIAVTKPAAPAPRAPTVPAKSSYVGYSAYQSQPAAPTAPYAAQQAPYTTAPVAPGPYSNSQVPNGTYTGRPAPGPYNALGPATNSLGGASSATTGPYVPGPTAPAPATQPPAGYTGYNQPPNAYVAQQPQQQAYPPANAGGYTPYNNTLTQHPALRAQNQPSQPAAVGPPPSGPTIRQAPPSGPPKRDAGGWNDAPANVFRTSSAAGNREHKPAPITSPFPNAPITSPGIPSITSPTYANVPPAPLPPPPRPGSVNARPPPGVGPGQHLPPPPGPGQYAPPPPGQGPGQYAPPPGQGPGQYAPPPPGQGPGIGGPPPTRIMSPPQGLQQRQPTPSQYGPPPGRAPGQPGVPPPGPGQQQYARPPPPGQPGHPGLVQGGSGPYARPPSQAGGPGPYGVTSPNGPGSGPYARATPPPLQSPPVATGPYGPPPGGAPQRSPAPPTGPPPPGGAGAGAPPAGRAPPTLRNAPPPPKYPPGDRSHIPESSLPAFNILSTQLNQLRQTQPGQKRLVDDLERRINPLFDALNCETLSQPVVDQLLVLCKAIAAHDRAGALAIHVDLLTKGSQSDEIGLWMAGVKQLIMRL